MDIGIFGGTFNPIHNGHLAAANAAVDKIPLDRVYMVPSSKPPHKTEKKLIPFSHRYKMVEMAVAGYPHLYTSDLDSTKDNSYTKNLIQRFRQNFPDDQLFLIIGADNIPELTTWYDYKWILNNINIVAINRKVDVDRKKEEYIDKIAYVTIPPVEISSSLVRERIIAGEDVSDLVPPEVCRYIENHELHRYVE